MKGLGSVLDLLSDLTETVSVEGDSASGEATETEVPTLLVAVEDIQPDPNQPRKEFDPDQLRNLANSIEKVGVLCPLLVSETGSIPPYQLIDGERRWLAAKLAGLKEVPAHVRTDLGGNEMVQIIANANRTDLTDFELAQAIQRILDTRKLKKKEIAVLINRSPSVVSRLLGMLDPEISPYIEEGLIRHAEVAALVRGLSHEQRNSLIEQARSDRIEITTTQVRELLATQDDRGSEDDSRKSEQTVDPEDELETWSVSDEWDKDQDNDAVTSQAQTPPTNIPPSLRGTRDQEGKGNWAMEKSTHENKREVIRLRIAAPDVSALLSLMTYSCLEDQVTAPVASIEIRMRTSIAAELLKEAGDLVPDSPSEFEPVILALVGKKQV